MKIAKLKDKNTEEITECYYDETLDLFAMITATREILTLLGYEVIETRELELPPFCGCDDLIKIEPSTGCCFPSNKEE